MKNIELFRAVGEIDDGLLSDAEALLNGTSMARKKPGPWVKWGGLAACLAVAACAAWMTLPQEGQRPQDVTPPPEIVQTPDIDRPAIEPAPEAVTRPIVEMNFNRLDREPERGVSAGFPLFLEDFVPMTREELLDYYGVTLLVEEAMPDYFAVGPEEGGGFGRGIYRRENGNVYCDTNSFAFESADGVRGVYVTLDKAFHMSTAPWELPGGSLDFTAVNGWELALFRYPDEEGNQCFYTEFLQNGVCYRVCGKNMCEQEYATVLGVLLEKREVSVPGQPRTFTGEYSGGFGLQALTTTNPDGSVTVKKTWHGPLHLTLDDGADYTGLSVELTEEQAEEFAGLSIGDRVSVTFVGEPATIGTVWNRQLVEIHK